VDAAGDAYASEAYGVVSRYRSQGGRTGWQDPHLMAIDPNPYGFTPRPIAADSAGGSVYILYDEPMRIGKVDSAGRSVWIKPLPLVDQESLLFEYREFSLHKIGDSLLVWEATKHVMAYLDLNGELLGQDTLLRLSPTSSYPRYKPGAGFFLITQSSIQLLDRGGGVLVDWPMESKGSQEGPMDLERDTAGRWYLLRGSGIVQVFSPDRKLLGTVLTGRYGQNLRHRYGRLFMLGGDAGGEVTEIVPGF
jgi:hypothetical protein